MKGIILKDLYENFRIFKNGVSYLAAVLFLFLLIEAMQTGDLFSLKYFFMLITAFVFPLLGCSSIESSLEQDEKVNFDKIQLQKRRSYCQNIYLESAFLQYATYSP